MVAPALLGGTQWVEGQEGMDARVHLVHPHHAVPLCCAVQGMQCTACMVDGRGGGGE